MLTVLLRCTDVLAGKRRAPFNLARPALWREEIDLMRRVQNVTEKQPNNTVAAYFSGWRCVWEGGVAEKQQSSLCQKYLLFRWQLKQSEESAISAECSAGFLQLK